MNHVPFSSLSASYQTLLNNFTSSGPFSLTINGLTVGDKYEFEWWSDLSLADFFSNSGSQLTTATAINSVVLNSNTTDRDSGVGQFAIGTFTADGTSEVIAFSSLHLAVVDGLQLRDLGPVASPPAPISTPEPSSLALLALGGVALAGWRRWKKRKATA